MFYKSSGLKLNISKTEILQIGKTLISKQKPFNLTWDKTRVYALGSWFYEDVKAGIMHTHKDKLKVMQETLKLWTKRKLTWIGKIAIIKSLGISKLNYTIASLETPEWFAVEAKEAILNFLWDGKPPRVKYKTLCDKVENGGLRMVDFDQYVMAQKANWIKRLLENKSTIPFHFLTQFLPKIDFEIFLKCSFDPDKLPAHIPSFYRQILCAWFFLKSDPKDICDIQREVIWLNKHILINDQEIFRLSFSRNLRNPIY